MRGDKVRNWDGLLKYFDQSPNKIEVSISESNKKMNLSQIDIGENTTIGLITHHCALLRVNGYLRIWGSGDNINHRNIVDSNDEFREYFGGNKVFIADDIWGGCYAISNGDFPGSPQYIWYYAPDTLQWENLEVTYCQFIRWVASTGIADFYKSFLWDKTFSLIDKISFEQGLSIYPPLWSKECDCTASISIISTKEIMRANIEIAKQFIPTRDNPE